MKKNKDTLIPIRATPEVREWVEQQAIHNRRTMSSEVLFQLEEIMRSQQLKDQQGERSEVKTA